jgi:histidyl-tRNA synthetase
VRVQIRVNSRELTDILLQEITPNSEHHAALYGLIDRTDKLTGDEYTEQLVGIGLTAEQQDRARQLLSERSLAAVRTEVSSAADITLYLEKMLGMVARNDMVEVVYDPTIVRGLSYYTGMVYECSLLDAKNMGSVGGGGRYDRQIGQFLGRDIPAVGGSFGLDRLIAGLEQLEALPTGVHLAQVALLPLAGCEEDAWNLACELRAAGVSVVNHPGGAAVGQMLGWSSSVAAHAIVVGTDEVAEQQFAVRDLTTRTEETLSVEDIKQYFHDR